MGESFLESLPPEEKSRLAYIEGREDLFRTKVLEIDPGKELSEAPKEVLVISRDPGSAAALMPVMEVLERDKSIKMKAVVDGRAQEAFERKFGVKDVTPQMALAADTVVGNPDVVLADSSTERGIETYAAATFREVPMVLVEDYYANTIGYLDRLKQRGMRFPEKICVMDEAAKKIILEKFPQVESSIEITGQPAFDRFATEDTKGIEKYVKTQLGVGESEKLVTIMSALEGRDFNTKLAAGLSECGPGLRFVFRRHPRDNISYEEYMRIFADAGIEIIDTNHLETNSVGAASDLVITSSSTEGLNGIYRRKPTIHVIDRELEYFKSGEIPPPVTLEASIGVFGFGELSKKVEEALNEKSALRAKIGQNMERYYPRDGKNSQRVAQVVESFLGRKD